ncbi:DoxX family protein [Haloferula sp.]|uniref:DoxX family protein n=1 Tax=Haloferula sp. TaxID=2497595 RepID=UPI00329D6F6A
MFHALLVFCALSFLCYGTGCLVGDHMVREFKRYGLQRFRKLTGLLQILGAIGLLVGLLEPLIGAIAASGLAVLMLLGFGVRLKIRDGFLLSLPSLLYLAVSAWLCSEFAKAIVM